MEETPRFNAGYPKEVQSTEPETQLSRTVCRDTAWAAARQ